MTTGSSSEPAFNPYVGPRTFVEAQRRLFFGRDREARDLTARIVAERLLLFYAQSGAGKSSLLNARVIPALRDEEGFQVLPVGRVSGAPSADAGQVANIYVFNLVSGLDQGGGSPAQLADVTLSDFLARLERETVVAEDGAQTHRWVYDPEIAVQRPAGEASLAGLGPRFVLIIDQFEELITGHPDRWEERADFFRQLNQALLDDPNLWMVLTLREDYLAALDLYAPLAYNRLRARFYMERMGPDAALEAISWPAELGGRPFAPGVAEKLVEDLRQVRVAGVVGAVTGPYVQPVQLQVVCHGLWERTAGEMITGADLEKAGDVNEALRSFYGAALAAVLAAPAVQASGLTERALRRWFEDELITPTGIRGTILRDEQTGLTGSLPNAAVDELSRRFLLSAELRGGDAWVELSHDRLVAPVRASNAAWFDANLSTLQRQAALWRAQKRPAGLLLTGDALKEAEAWAAAHGGELAEHEAAFLAACVKAREDVERERRRSRVIKIVAAIAGVFAVLALIAAVVGVRGRQQAIASAYEADRQRSVAFAASTAEAIQKATAEASAREALAQREAAVTAEAKAVTSAKEALAQKEAAVTAEAKAAANEKLASDRLSQLLLLVGADVADDPAARRQLVLFLSEGAIEMIGDGKAEAATDVFGQAAVLEPDYGFVAELPQDPETVGGVTLLLARSAAKLAQEKQVEAAKDAFARAEARDPGYAFLADVSEDAAVAGWVAQFLTWKAVELEQAGETGAANGAFARAATLDPAYATVVVPAGTFTMGSARDDRDAFGEEKPQLQINVDEFRIMRTEVTNAQYARCVEAGACGRPQNDVWDQPEYAAHPVTDVSWYQADDYARWVGGRLPSEAEWEKACRGVDGRIYSWGDEWNSSKANSAEGGPGGTTPVGHYSPQGDSPYRAADMVGNVWEWTSSGYAPYPYVAGDGREVPPVRDRPENPGKPAKRVMRSGAYNIIPRGVRCATRFWDVPDISYVSAGFRVAFSP